MSGKKIKFGPIILIASLIVVLFFIVGVRYGEKVERINKTVNYLLNISPTKPQPTPEPLSFLRYKSESCGIEFLYPSVLDKKRETNHSVVFLENKKPVLEFDCSSDKNINKSLIKKSEETIFFKRKKIVIKKKNGLTTFRVKNPYSGTYLHLSVKDSLLPLLEKSLSFFK